MGNYILWGKDPITGLNAKQAGLVDIPTKHGTWDKDSSVESLDGLMEMPTFNEAALAPLERVPTKIPREIFSREDALRECPDYLRPDFLSLFHQIDELDYTIQLYEEMHGKRTKPIRDTLANQFAPSVQQELREIAARWSQYHYLKQRHQLVEMRRQQYTMRDAYKQQIAPRPAPVVDEMPTARFGEELPVFPCGLVGQCAASSLMFRTWENLIPAAYNEEQLRIVSDFIWEKKAQKPGRNQLFFDFRIDEHVYQLFKQYYEFAEDDVNEIGGLPSDDKTRTALLATLEFYVARADLNEVWRDVLTMKMEKMKNVDIAEAVNAKWGRTYTPNYISTIFHQRIIPQITGAAIYHEKIVSNIFFEEEFKVCTGCGRTLLRDADNFTRKSRSKDGFTSRCKACEKAVRQARAKQND